ncbi:MAG: hypothetical protein Q7V53_07285 [Caldisericota bacterium]|nr:hypothetical protein [Caldisericota bacterium]
MATNSTPAAKTTKTPKVQKPLVERLDDQLGRMVLQKKVSADELRKLQEKIGKYLTFLE